MEQLNKVCGNSCPLGRGQVDYGETQCAAKAKVVTALHTTFKFEGFRPGQLESTLAAIHGRDVFVRMATGAGKSLCIFLVPLAVSDTAMGVVISPLNALMEQQVRISVLIVWNIR